MKRLYYFNFVALLVSALLPESSFSVYQGGDTYESCIAIKYQPTVSNFKNFHIKETDFDTLEPIGFRKSMKDAKENISSFLSFWTLEQTDSYKSYGNDLSGLAASIALSTKNLRVEFEGSYKRFDIKRLENYASKDGDRYFAIPREVSFFQTYPLSDSYFASFLGYTVAKNNGLSIISNMINLCYETKLDNFTPYVCLGCGGDFIEIFDSMKIKFAYQGKVGISYPISPRLALLISGQYHKVVGDEFKFLPVNQLNPIKRTRSSAEEYGVTALLTLELEYFSTEIGLSFTF